MDGITFYGRYFNVITMNTQSQKVSMAEKIGYSLGDCSANLVFQMMMIYQTKFYTDIFGLEGAIAGTVMLVARITDAFVDPTVGLLSDRTKTRFGKYRPWVLWTALPFMVFYVLAFYNPGIEDKGLVALYATLSYTLLMSLYSFNNTPYASLGGVMSGDIKERTSITSIRFVAACPVCGAGTYAPFGKQVFGWWRQSAWLVMYHLFVRLYRVRFSGHYFLFNS